jgi:hypothetical protein
MVKVPDWLAHPEVCPISVNVPEPEVISETKLPCIVIVLVAIPPVGVQDIVISTILPFIMAGLRLPVRVVPAPKQGERLAIPVKLRLLAARVVLLWVRLKVKVPGCCTGDVESAADHDPFTELECGLPPQALRKVARARAADWNRYRITGHSGGLG